MINLKRFHAVLLLLVPSFIIAAALPILCFAQEVASIDVTQTAADSELRRPAAHDGKSVVSFSGSRDIHECDPSKRSSIGKLQATLVLLDKHEYQVGDHPRFEIRIENTGDTPLTIPFSPRLSDLQPADAGEKFAYSELNVVLWIGGPTWRANTGGALALYGAERVPSTLQMLHPGEWIKIIGEGHLTLPNSPTLAPSDRVSEANAKVSLYRDETLLTASARATVATALCFDQTQGASVAIKLANRTE